MYQGIYFATLRKQDNPYDFAWLSLLTREGFKTKNYETYNNERKEQVFAKNSKYLQVIASLIQKASESKYFIASNRQQVP